MTDRFLNLTDDQKRKLDQLKLLKRKGGDASQILNQLEGGNLSQETLIEAIFYVADSEQ